VTGRQEMVEILRRMGIAEGRVLAAIAAVDRADFVPEERRSEAYEDYPLPIGFGQTISQPYTVARMVELMIGNITPPRFTSVSPLILGGDNTKVLEIGTGSGWQTAILARLFKQVYSIEVVPELTKMARKRIIDFDGLKPPHPFSSPLLIQERGKGRGFTKIRFKIGDGKEGWKEYAPYDAIICGANAQEIPEAWVEQLKVGGRIVVPIKGIMTRITKITHPLTPSLSLREGEQYMEWEESGRFDFVPLV